MDFRAAGAALLTIDLNSKRARYCLHLAWLRGGYCCSLGFTRCAAGLDRRHIDYRMHLQEAGLAVYPFATDAHHGAILKLPDIIRTDSIPKRIRCRHGNGCKGYHQRPHCAMGPGTALDPGASAPGHWPYAICMA